MAALAVGPYVPELGHPFHVDDAVQILENPAVTRGVPLARYFTDRETTSTRPDYNTRIWRPVRALAFRALWRAGIATPLGFGVTNLVLYAACALLVLAIVLGSGVSRGVALVAAGLWALLPVHVEPVAYASGLGDLLSAGLELAAVLLFMSSLPETRGRGARMAFAALSLVLAAAAMLAKEMAVTLPLILLLGAFISRVRKAWPLVTAHVVVAVVYLTLRTSVVGRVGQEDVTVHSVLVGLREAPVLLVAYLRLAVMPFGHSMAYVVGTPGTLKLALTCAGLAGGAVLAWWVDRRYRPAPGLRYALGWFTITLLPVLHLVPLWADLADRFLLVPSVGVALFVASIGMWLPERRRAFAAVAALALAVAYAVGVRVESRFWRSEVALWSNAVAEAPGSALAHWNLGSALLGVDPAGALAELERARSLGRGGADLSLRRGMALAALDRHAEAEAAVLAALAEDPGLHRAHAVLGEILIRLGKIPEAKRELASARALTPEHPSTALLEGALAYAEGRLRDAASAYAALAARFPSQARFQFLAAQSAERAGDRAAAKEHARKCLQLAPEQEQCREITGRP